MALSVDSKIKELAKNEEANAICEKYGFDFTDKRAKMTFGMTLRALAAFPQTGCTPEKLEELSKELEAANLE
jgi:hypothetical protein